MRDGWSRLGFGEYGRGFMGYCVCVCIKISKARDMLLAM